MTSPIHIEIFAGAGGMAIGCRLAGFETARYYELDRHCCETLRHNIEATPSTLAGEVIEGSVATIDWRPYEGTVGLLAGGAPCQPFSLAGKHEGFRDRRNMFPEVIRAVREARPSAILLENVRGILRPDFRPYFEYVLRQLADPSLERRARESWRSHSNRLARHQLSRGYEPEYSVVAKKLNAADFGVPQLRERVFIVATGHRDFAPFEMPAPSHSRAALERAQASGEYWERHGIRRRHASGELSLDLDESGRKPWVTVRDAISDLHTAAASEEDACMNHWRIPGARAYHGHGGSLLDWPAKTIKAGVHGVPGGENSVICDNGVLRYLTLRETARIQTFPDEHFFVGARSHVCRQIGNAVPCRLAYAVAASLPPGVRHSRAKTADRYGGRGRKPFEHRFR